MANCITRHIPNTLTCLNLFSGCIAIIMAHKAQYDNALLFIFLSATFDFFDGMAARLLKAFSNIGKDLDSLADNVSFGVAPSFVVFSFLQELTYPEYLSGVEKVLPYSAFLISVFSALRLAKFNNDTRQTCSFIGLPVPANALFWAAAVASLHTVLASNQFNPLFVVIAVCVFSWLLVSEVPMFSLKFKNLSWKDNKVSFIFLIGCILLITLLHVKGVACSIVWYIALSICTQKK